MTTERTLTVYTEDFEGNDWEWEISMRVSGRYIPGTLEDPPEYPEVEWVSASGVNLVTGATSVLSEQDHDLRDFFEGHGVDSYELDLDALSQDDYY